MIARFVTFVSSAKQAHEVCRQHACVYVHTPLFLRILLRTQVSKVSERLLVRLEQGYHKVRTGTEDSVYTYSSHSSSSGRYRFAPGRRQVLRGAPSPGSGWVIETDRWRSEAPCVRQGVPRGQTESGGIVLAVICWSPSNQRRCYPTGRCAYRPSVIP
jgi:hypothetical protein